jgi:hypothetical protein
MGKALGSAPHGGTGTRLYKRWADMRNRCLYEKHSKYHRYGGRGITVCEEWITNFAAFRDWALASGYASDLEIDRIDNNGHYTPRNCRWVTHEKNCRNRENTVLLTLDGESKTLQEWTEDPRCEVGFGALHTRFYRQGVRDSSILKRYQRPVYVNNQKRSYDRACWRYAKAMGML